ncbi:hypothetical protein GCM10023168_22090 [Fodinibacter luteus]|uniref:Uncharacterized protein n=1 Tax=Fodinibacter luteus TaxID=552064 RepID=A0ABP8KHE7_9MICO
MHVGIAGSYGQLFQGAGESELVQGSGSKPFNDPSDIGHRGLSRGTQLEQFCIGVFEAVPAVAQLVDFECEAGQRRPEPVVQVAAEPSSLFLSRQDQPVLRGAQRVDQAGGVDDAPELARDVGEQPSVPVAQVVAAGPEQGAFSP